MVLFLGLAYFTVRILLVPFIAALFLVYLFEPGVTRLGRREFTPGTAFLILFGSMILALGTFLAFVPGWLSIDEDSEIQSVIAGSSEDEPSEFTVRLESQLRAVDDSIKARLPFIESFDIAGEITNRGTSFVLVFFESLTSIVGSFTINLMLVPLLAYFIVRDGKQLKRRLIQLVPNRYFEMSLMMLHQIGRQVGGYFRGRFVESVLVGVSMMVAMGVASLWTAQPFILLIAVVIGTTNLIPYVGPLMGLAFGALLYLGLGSPMASILGLAIAVAIAQLLDNLVFVPVVLSQNVDLHPLTVILVLLIGGEILGVLGLLIAVPAAASVKIVAEEMYRNYSMQVR